MKPAGTGNPTIGAAEYSLGLHLKATSVNLETPGQGSMADKLSAEVIILQEFFSRHVDSTFLSKEYYKCIVIVMPETCS